MKKRIISLLLATAMIVSVATVVNAATQIKEGEVVTLPANNLVVDGGFETASVLNPNDPPNKKSYIPTFTATEDKGLSTERTFNNAQIISEAGIPIEGKQCILLQKEENATIALPNLYDYKGGKLMLTYYVKAKAATAGYGTWGKLEDRSVTDVPVVNDKGEPVIDEATGKQKTDKFLVVANFKDAINYWSQPGSDTPNDPSDDTSFDKVWTCLKEEITIPDTITQNSQYVLNFGSFGNVVYFDAISCVVVKADGTEVDPAAFATPAPTAAPTPDANEVTIKFTKKSAKIKKGKKVTLKVKLSGAKKATFSVDKKGKKVVKLSKKKAKSVVVTGKKKGKATITAKAAGKKATCKVTVK